jgi:hypothetical protein
MKTIVVVTKKIVAHKENGTPITEEIKQKLSPEMTFNKFLKYLSNQYYTSVTVVEAFEGKKALDVKEYQEKVDNAMEKKQSDRIDYKALSEKQSKQLEEALKRLEVLENKSTKDNARERLEAKAIELEISFRANIGNDKLLAKIQEIEPDFEL